MKTKLLSTLFITAILGLLSNFSAYAQQGYLDTTFGTNGIVTMAQNVTPAAMCIQQDGKILLAGKLVDGTSTNNFMYRYHPDGTLDGSFGTGGMIQMTQGASAIAGIAEMPDGQIVAVVGGWRVMRFSNAGVLDTSLGENGFLRVFNNGSPSKMKLLPDGKILISGNSYATGGSPTRPSTRITGIMVKLNHDLSLDTSFSGNGIYDTNNPNRQIFTHFDVGNDGSIIVLIIRRAGRNNAPNMQLIKLNANGNTVASFGSSGVTLIEFGTSFDNVTDVKILESGKVLLSGKKGSLSTVVLKRLNDNASDDDTYGASGLFTFGGAPETQYTAFASWELGDGRIVSAVHRKHDDFFDYGLLFTHDDGVIDTTEGIDGFVMTPLSAQSLTCAIRQPDGKIIAAGNDANGLVMVRYNTEATLKSDSFKGNLITVFPNPATDSFKISNLPDSTNITLYSISGQKLLEVVSHGETNLDISSLQAGVYFLSTPYGSKKIVKH